MFRNNGFENGRKNRDFLKSFYDFILRILGRIVDCVLGYFISGVVLEMNLYY